MKSVLISIQPKWCELIASGKKTVEVRKTKPKLDTPFKCYIYCTNTKPYLAWGDEFCGGSWETKFSSLFGYSKKDAERIFELFNGKVIGEFVCDDIRWANGLNLLVKEDAEATLKGSCLTKEDIYKYLGVESGMSRYDKKTEFYRWHISDLVIYDKPKELSEFYSVCEKGNCHLCDWEREYDSCGCNREKPIKRPPQSWCYVEEVKADDKR